MACRRCHRCCAREDNLCQDPQGWAVFTHPGGFEERLVAPLDRLTLAPASIDPVHDAPLTCALGTAYRAVATRGCVAAGASAAVIGLGEVGIHALQIAAAGARTFGVDISPRTVQTARELGLRAVAADKARSCACTNPPIAGSPRTPAATGSPTWASARRSTGADR